MQSRWREGIAFVVAGISVAVLMVALGAYALSRQPGFAGALFALAFLAIWFPWVVLRPRPLLAAATLFGIASLFVVSVSLYFCFQNG